MLACFFFLFKLQTRGINRMHDATCQLRYVRRRRHCFSLSTPPHLSSLKPSNDNSIQTVQQSSHSHPLNNLSSAPSPSLSHYIYSQLTHVPGNTSCRQIKKALATLKLFTNSNRGKLKTKPSCMLQLSNTISLSLSLSASLSAY